MSDIPDVTIKDLYVMLQSVLEKNSEIKEEIKENRESFSRQLLEIKQDFSKNLQNLKTENEVLKEENKKLKDTINNIERRTKKYNLIVYGIKEESHDVEDIEKVIHLFNSTLNIPCAFADFRDIFRLGTFTEGKNRPVLVEVVSYQLKREILNNAKKLQGSSVFIAPDYSSEDYANRKILASAQKEARKLNLEAKISKDNLIIDGKKYTIEELRTTPGCIRERLHKEGNIEITKTGHKLNKNNCEGGSDNTNLEEKTGTKRKQEATDGHKVKRSARINSSNKI